MTSPRGFLSRERLIAWSVIFLVVETALFVFLVLQQNNVVMPVGPSSIDFVSFYAATSLALVGLSILLLGWHTWRAYFVAMSGADSVYTSGRINFAGFVSLFVVLPRRWVVERTLAWLSRNRRLAKDFETLIATAEAWTLIASINDTPIRCP